MKKKHRCRKPWRRIAGAVTTPKMFDRQALQAEARVLCSAEMCALIRRADVSGSGVLRGQLTDEEGRRDA